MEYLRIAFTRDEASIMEEALELYGRQLRDDAGDDPSPVQAWAMDRAERIRAALLAGIEDRPWVDSGEREYAGPDGQDPPSEARPSGSAGRDRRSGSLPSR